MATRVLLIHGSAADHTTWSIQLHSPVLAERFVLTAYDRPILPSVEQQAEVALTYLEQPAIVVGSSFGAVIALEVIRRRPQLGAVLIEPPMGATDEAPAAPAAFLAEYDRRAERQGGRAAAEFFLRTVLGDEAFERMPKTYRDRATAKHAEIRADSAALIAYRPRYGELASVKTPVLLLGGERSAAYFRPTLEALVHALPEARLEIVPSAGHMLHAEASRTFANLLFTFANQVA
ncbi:MAG TPA: alpha/beta hydrolase [Kofleriaceae bacterium]|nr:alpha/beta hydrolase [Kofleriaceae bacterium]